MPDPEPSSRDRPALSLGSDDWPATVADKIVEIVDAVRVQTTDRAVFLLRAVVYCLVAAVAAIAVIVLLTIAANSRGRRLPAHRGRGRFSDLGGPRLHRVACVHYRTGSLAGSDRISEAGVRGDDRGRGHRGWRRVLRCDRRGGLRPASRRPVNGQGRNTR